MRYFASKRNTILTLLAVVLLCGCQKKVAKAPVAPAPTASSPATPTVTLQASPATLTRGESTTLTWSSSNATQVTLAPEGGNVVLQGSRRVTPADSVTYTIRASGPGGTATATASIAVSVPRAAAPAAPEPGEAQLFQQNVKDAFFDYDKADIRTDAQDALTRDADFLRTHPDIRVTVEGHCDERGGEEYNLALGDRRATSTKQYLVTLGVSADHIQTESLGKEQPFCTTEAESCYQQNRRGHLLMAR